MSGTVIAGALLGGLIAAALLLTMPTASRAHRFILMLVLLGIYWSGLYIAVEQITKATS